MLQNLILSVNIVLPLLLIMVAGCVAAKLRLCSEGALAEMNTLAFRVFLPILLCNNIRTADLSRAHGLSVLAFAVVLLLIVFAAAMLLVPKFVPENARRGVVVQGIFRSNYALFGIAVISAMYPAGDMTIPSLMIPATVPIYNALAVVCLEAFRGGRVDPRALAKKIATNPLIIGSLLGVALLLMGNPVPTALDRAMIDLGRIGTPLALFILGASFKFDALAGNLRALLGVSALKLVILPVLTVLLAVAMGYRGPALMALTIAFGGPIAVSSFTMAQQMEGDGQLAAQLVVVTTLLSVVTIFGFIFAFMTLGLA